MTTLKNSRHFVGSETRTRRKGHRDGPYTRHIAGGLRCDKPCAVYTAEGAPENMRRLTFKVVVLGVVTAVALAGSSTMKYLPVLDRPVRVESNCPMLRISSSATIFASGVSKSYVEANDGKSVRKF